MNLFKTFRTSLLLVLAASLSNLLTAETYNVSSASEIPSTLSPGDVVVWADGSYSDQSIKLYDLEGEPDNPIIIRAATPGGVELTGTSRLFLWGKHIIVEGFYFNGDTTNSYYVQFRKDGGDATQMAESCVLRNCAFNNADSSDGKKIWIRMYGYYNVIEHCSFLNKATTGECINIILEYNDASSEAGHIIRNNHFYNFANADGRDDAGDSETIIIGLSEYQNVNASVTVENNYFVSTDMENEIISSKSSNNTFLHNTFRRCRGGLVLRHGTGAWVEGNFFIGEGKDDTGGIRIVDQDHTIINNYMEGLRGTIWNAGITWMGGNTASGSTSNGYQYVKNVVVAHNTLYDCAETIRMNGRKGGTAPENCVMANNLIETTYSDIFTFDDPSVNSEYSVISTSGISFEGNIMYGATLGISANAGIDTTSDPAISLSDGIYRPSASGPAADAAAGTYDYVVEDLEGYDRPETGKDIGALEVSGATGNALYAPITDEDVGYDVGACFLDSDGTLLNCDYDSSSSSSYPYASSSSSSSTSSSSSSDSSANSSSISSSSSSSTSTPDPVVDGDETTFYSTDDVYVNAGNETTNYSTAEKMEVKADGDWSKEAYLQFDISSLEGSVTSATLILAVRGEGTGIHTAYAISDDWDQSTLTWSTKPAHGNSYGTVDMSTATDFAQFDVTDYVSGEASGDGIVSIAIASDTASTVTYHSGDTGNLEEYPILVVTTTESSTFDPFEGISGNDSWKESTWFGTYQQSESNENWFISEDLGLLFAYPVSTPERIYTWDALSEDFHYFTKTIYPYAYKYGDGAWIWIWTDYSDANLRWYWNFSTEQWVKLQ